MSLTDFFLAIPGLNIWVLEGIIYLEDSKGRQIKVPKKDKKEVEYDP